jgi:predicted dehydrogenase
MVGWGVVATGGIADVVTADMRLVDGTEVRAVSSRDIDRAARFAARHGIAKSYGNHQDLVADPDVDVVYVATPHSSHFAVARDALLAGKAVLCEKPLTMSSADTEELVGLARRQGVFLMEAMWTRFNPLVRKLRQLVKDGAIGQVRSVHSDFGAVFPEDLTHRIWDPALGGGSLLDVGVYPVAFAQMVLGEPEEVIARGTLHNTVDAEAALLLRYPGGEFAQLTSSAVGHYPVTAMVVGTAGRVEILPEFFRATEMVVTRAGAEPERETLDLWGSGYTYQIAEVNERLAAGDKESPEMPLDDTLAVARVLTEALTQLGVSYPDTVR